MKRSEFIRTSALALGAGALPISTFNACRPADKETGLVMTVQGPVTPETLGLTLTHEHVLVDFIGADRVNPDRYDADDVLTVVLPYLQQARELGCQTLIECTPAYLGRDAALLRRLSQASGLAIVTNTGYYGAVDDEYIPAHAYQETAHQLAARWTREWREGIDGTDIRPGFIKTGVDNGALSAIDAKLVRAAALTHLETGLSIASHTGYAVPAREQLAILAEEGVHPSAWIWVHAQSEPDSEHHAWAARQGAWLSFDGISHESLERHLTLVTEMKRLGLLHKVLLSHDAGWSRPGETGGGDFRPFDTLFTEFIPALREIGFTTDEISQLTVTNSQQAFLVHIRKQG
ncbi:MAG: phosphotriesterase [Fidelibacterota bacterium]|nr:MAG: phosphotriesterase [Candidatus Neomarinimicrobiota bacterium]